jgi:glycine reductase
MSVGANRIVQAVAIPHPTGNPNLGKEEELGIRKGLIDKALMALSTKIDEQTVF